LGEAVGTEKTVAHCARLLDLIGLKRNELDG
jgi:hypothetical protein